jgi:hypothetical protein
VLVLAVSCCGSSAAGPGVALCPESPGRHRHRSPFRWWSTPSTDGPGPPAARWRGGAGVDAGAGWRPLLRSLWPLTEGRRQELPPAFTAQAREGDPGGRRGFSRQADDDGDGLIDEDPLDGRDNDGDGLIDEDHAAISHLMGVWDQTLGERGRHLETYHWSYDHLAGLMIAVYSQHGGGLVENLRLELTEPGRWQGVDEVCHQLSSPCGRPSSWPGSPASIPATRTSGSGRPCSTCNRASAPAPASGSSPAPSWCP